MEADRREDTRVACRECRSEQMFSEDADGDSFLFYYVNRSSRGLGAYIQGAMNLRAGQVFYIIRNHVHAFYQIRWVKEIEKQSFIAGLRVMDSGEGTEKKTSKSRVLKGIRFNPKEQPGRVAMAIT
jgi:hypothetical protein